MKQVLKETLTIAAVLCGLFVCLVIGCLLALELYLVSGPHPMDSTGERQCVANCAVYGFQDGTTYQEYRYTTASFDNNTFFRPVAEDDMAKIRAYVKNYEGVIRCEPDCTVQEAWDLYQNYRYDIDSLSEATTFIWIRPVRTIHLNSMNSTFLTRRK